MFSHTRLCTALLGVAMLLPLASCKTTESTTREVKDSTGALTRLEMEQSANFLATGISNYFQSKGALKNILIALLPTKNKTSDQIQVEILDNALVSELSKRTIVTVRTEDRVASLKELSFNLSGMGDGTMSAGNMKSPNYFIKIEINENLIRNGDDRIMEHTINAELRDVESQMVMWSDKKVFRQTMAKAASTGW